MLRKKVFRNTLYFFSVLIFQLFLFNCASTPQNARGPIKPKPMVAPWEYYASTQPAIMHEGETPRMQNMGVEPLSDDTKSDRTHTILIGTLVGVLVVGGTVAGVLIAK